VGNNGSNFFNDNFLVSIFCDSFIADNEKMKFVLSTGNLRNLLKRRRLKDRRSLKRIEFHICFVFVSESVRKLLGTHIVHIGCHSLRQRGMTMAGLLASGGG
jgi:hypothetical protein